MPKMSASFVAREAAEENLIPAGEYKASIAETAIRLSADGSEEVLLLESKLETGAMIIDWLRINSSNSIVREIARKSLAQLCLAVGIEELEDTDDLHGQTLVIRVTTHRGEGYAPRNRFAYFPLRGALETAS